MRQHKLKFSFVLFLDPVTDLWQSSKRQKDRLDLGQECLHSLRLYEVEEENMKNLKVHHTTPRLVSDFSFLKHKPFTGISHNAFRPDSHSQFTLTE